jgi:hypothetical protein
MRSGPKPWPLPDQSKQQPANEVEIATPNRHINTMQSNSVSTPTFDGHIADPNPVSNENKHMNRDDNQVLQQTDTAEPSSLHASARPVVIPIQKKFALVDTGDITYRGVWFQF